MTEAPIRPARKADLAALVALHVASWQASYGDALPADALRDEVPRHLAAKWADRLEKGTPFVTLMAGDGPLDGFVCAMPDRAPPLIDNLHVRPGLHSRGLGARLLGAMLDALVARGAPRVDLFVLETNLRARAFYARHGGRDLGGLDDALIGRPVRVRRIAFDLSTSVAP
jgi:ribosomal protein S18 acetylase RimI-like enzyme